MISKRVFISAAQDNYARLAAYIAAAGSGGEKCLMAWCAGMLGGDDYSEGMAEAMDVQKQNTRAAHKTYHQVISFRPQDETTLTPELLKTIEERFAAALGYADHQRHCGVHKNTANLHMHVAYNMIHPEKYTCHKEFRDFRIRDAVCRALEREFGLTMDNGIEHSASDRPRRNETAMRMEAHSGQQSFASYAAVHQDELLRVLEAATSWQDLHEALAARGMEIKTRGDGMVVKNRHGKSAIKASALDRSLSLKRLEDRFGPYRAAQRLEQVRELSRYEAAPWQRSPERGNLYAKYRAGIEARKTRLQDIKEKEVIALAAIHAQWAIKRKELERKNIAKKNLRRLLQLTRKHELEAAAKARLTFAEARGAVGREVPFTTWNGFLRQQAEGGNEAALAILRSQTEVIPTETSPTSPADVIAHVGGKALHAAGERAILEHDAITDKGKKSLLAVLRMKQVLQSLSPTESRSCTWEVDNKGAVLFLLSGGGSIRDNGRKILFSAGDSDTARLAQLYGQLKWGKNMKMVGNSIALRIPSRHLGMAR